MFELSILSGLGVVALTLPGFLLLVRREWEHSGAGLFLLSPAMVFYLAYLASFAIRPPLQVAGTLQYDFTVAAGDTLFLAQASSVLAWYGFVIGYRLIPSPAVPALLARAGSVALDVRLRASAAYGLSIAASLVFVAFIAPLGVFTLDFGYNRVAYLNALSGAGHLYLFNLMAGTWLLIGLVFSSFCQRSVRLLSVAAWAAYLIPNAFVTNRFLVSATLFALLFVVALKRMRRGERISATTVVAVLGLLAGVGAILGLVRGLSEGLEYAEERRNPLVFFLWSFDMSEYYQSALQNVHSLDLGRSWVEDLFLQFLPRALFPWKPQIYGAVRLQAEVMPGSIPADGVLSATYPIGMFGEGYANFGIPGLLLVGLLVGMILKLVFSKALRAGLVPRRPFWPLACFCLFVLVCANTLGYLRSFGWFLSSLVFHGVVYACCYFAVWVIAGLCTGAIETAKRAHPNAGRGAHGD
jgi:hypothetical protein